MLPRHRRRKKPLPYEEWVTMVQTAAYKRVLCSILDMLNEYTSTWGLLTAQHSMAVSQRLIHDPKLGNHVMLGKWILD